MEFIEKQNGRYWGFASLRPHSEKIVVQTLKRKGIRSYLPVVSKARLHHGTKIVTQVPLIAGYVFLSLNSEERSELKRSDDHFVQIELLRDAQIENIFISELNALRKFELLAQTEKVLVQPGIRKGDRILITQGSLKGLETEVIRRDDDHDSIVINITILNKSVEYPVSLEDLKKITS